VLNDYAGTNQYRVNQPWIDAVLATNTLLHVFALGHVPAFKLLHTDCLGLYPAERGIFWNSLSNAHARIYFSGHDHFYEHARIDDADGDPENDLHAFTVGPGGAPLYLDGVYSGTNGIWSPSRIFHESQIGFLLVEVNGDQVRTTWHHRADDGDYPTTADVFTYFLGPRPVLSSSYVGGNLVLAWSGPALLESGPDPSGFFATVPDATSPYVVPLTSASGRFFRLALPWP
jgi:hypothetical protein